MNNLLHGLGTVGAVTPGASAGLGARSGAVRIFVSRLLHDGERLAGSNATCDAAGFLPVPVVRILLSHLLPAGNDGRGTRDLALVGRSNLTVLAGGSSFSTFTLAEELKGGNAAEFAGPISNLHAARAPRRRRATAA